MPANPFSGGPKGYRPGFTGQAGQGAWQGVAGRAGATKDPKTGQYDFSKSFNQIKGPEGIKQSKAGYSWDPVQKATEGLGQRRSLGRVNFGSLPQKYGQLAYERGAKNIRREGTGQLTQLQEAMGTRRPGLLAKAAQDSQRATREELAGLGSDIERDIMQQELDLDVKEQIANLDQQRAEEIMDLDRLGALSNVGFDTIRTESGLLGQERAYQDQALDYLMNIWQQAMGADRAADQLEAQNRASTLGFLSSLNPFGG